jgi:hypothetical protein
MVSSICSLACLAGCGGSGLHSVTGHVNYRGQPVLGALVTFACQEANSVASGMTDAQGNFTLSTYRAGNGAVVGTHQVTVTKFTPGSGGVSSSASMEEMVKPPPAVAPQNQLPARYATAATSGLEFTVTAAGPNEFTIELTD